jgi:hypothetical protein
MACLPDGPNWRSSSLGNLAYVVPSGPSARFRVGARSPADKGSLSESHPHCKLARCVELAIRLHSCFHGIRPDKRSEGEPVEPNTITPTGTDPQTGTQPTSTPALAPEVSQAAPPPPSPPSVGAGAAGAAAPAPIPSGAGDGGYLSVRDALANYGLDVRQQFQDDHQALQHLVGVAQQWQQAQQMLPYAQQYMRHAGQFQQWMAQQQQAAQQAQTQQQSWWKAPEYDPSWSQKLMRDPQTGEIKALPGQDPSIVGKYLAWVDHQRGFMDKFAQDPIGAIRPGIEQLVREQAQQLIQQHLGQFQERSLAQQVLQQNADWMYDQSGPINPQTGMPPLTPLGRQYAQYIFRAESMGITNTRDQHEYALGFLQRDYALGQLQGQGQQPGNPSPAQQQPVAPGANAAAQQFLQQARQGAANPAAPAQNVNGNYQAPNGLSARGLQEAMLKELQANGIQPGQQLF